MTVKHIRRVTTSNMNCLSCYKTKIYNKTKISTYGLKSKILPEDKIRQLIKFFKNLLSVFNFG